MYGINVHKAVLKAGDEFSGPTVHLVDETYDTGRIIARKKVNIGHCVSAEEIAAEVLKAEHKLLPFVLSRFASGEKSIDPAQVDLL